MGLLVYIMRFIPEVAGLLLMEGRKTKTKTKMERVRGAEIQSVDVGVVFPCSFALPRLTVFVRPV
jgi:hypothetical protein